MVETGHVVCSGIGGNSVFLIDYTNSAIIHSIRLVSYDVIYRQSREWKVTCPERVSHI